jgi:hypothetical protein
MNGGHGRRDPEPTGFREFKVTLVYRTSLIAGDETRLGHAVVRATGASLTLRTVIDQAALAKVTPEGCAAEMKRRLMQRSEKAVRDYLRCSHWPFTWSEDDLIETRVEEL